MRDEKYVLDLCDEVLGQESKMQHHFEFLRGDRCRDGSIGRQLPVDAFYPKLNLVIEYHERQHSEAVPLFDHRSTVSGVSRGAQRKRYDQLRRDVLPRNGIELVEMNVADFPLSSSKRLCRNRERDIEVICGKLVRYVKPRRMG